MICCDSFTFTWIYGQWTERSGSEPDFNLNDFCWIFWLLILCPLCFLLRWHFIDFNGRFPKTTKVYGPSWIEYPENLIMLIGSLEYSRSLWTVKILCVFLYNTLKFFSTVICFLLLEIKLCNSLKKAFAEKGLLQIL